MVVYPECPFEWEVSNVGADAFSNLPTKVGRFPISHHVEVGWDVDDVTTWIEVSDE